MKKIWLVLAVLAVGCGGAGDAPKPAGATKVAPGGSAHDDHGPGPNGGVVFDLGKHHAEFTVDHEKKQCAILMLGGDEKTIVRVAATELKVTTKPTKTKDGTAVPAMTIVLRPVDAKDGKASRFVGEDPGLGNVADFAGTAAGVIDGKPASEDFAE